MADKGNKPTIQEDEFLTFEDIEFEEVNFEDVNPENTAPETVKSGNKAAASKTAPRSAAAHSSASSSAQHKKHSGKKKSSKKKKRGRRRNETFLHLGIIAAIAIIVIVAIVRLVIWNIGKDSGYDPNADSTEYETEALDYIQPLDAEKLAGREDDGITTIVCLGNEPFTDETGKDGLAQMIARKCDATVYNCAFPDSHITMKNLEYSDEYPQDALSLFLVTASICGGDYTLMEHAASRIPTGSDIAMENLETLKSIDFETVDMIVMMYDLHDYMNKRPVMDVNNNINLLTWNGALNASIQHVQQTYPHIRLVVLSPTFAQFKDSNGEMINGDLVDFGNGVLPDYVLHQIDVAIANGVSILDNYYGTINEYAADDCLTDGYHLNKNGRERIAARFAKEIFYIE